MLDDLSSGSPANLPEEPGVDLVEGSVLDAELVARLASGCDAIVHLAARPSVPGSVGDPLGTHAHNARGTLHVLEGARRAGGVHTIIASSSAVYGDHLAAAKHEELAPRPLSPYAADKLASEASARAYASSYGLPTLAFRFFNVYGPLQDAGHVYAAVVPAFVDAALAGRPLQVHGDGLQTRDFVDVGTLTDVIAMAVERRVTSPGPVNLALGTQRTILDVAETLERVLGRPLPREHTPSRAGDVRASRADPSRLLELFPDATLDPFEEGIRAPSTGTAAGRHHAIGEARSGPRRPCGAQRARTTSSAWCNRASDS